MIKIIEEGKKEFIMICDHCGCKFSYQLEDLGKDVDGLHLASKDNQVRCPYCGEWHYHPHQDPSKEKDYDYWYRGWSSSPFRNDYINTSPIPTKNINSDEGFEFTTVTKPNYKPQSTIGQIKIVTSTNDTVPEGFDTRYSLD